MTAHKKIMRGIYFCCHILVFSLGSCRTDGLDVAYRLKVVHQREMVDKRQPVNVKLTCT